MVLFSFFLIFQMTEVSEGIKTISSKDFFVHMQEIGLNKKRV